MVEQIGLRTEVINARAMDGGGRIRTSIQRLKARFGDDQGGVSTIAGIAVLTIGVVFAAGLVVATMRNHAESVPEPGDTVSDPTGGGTGE